MASPTDPSGQSTAIHDVASLIFVGFNSRIAALDRTSGEVAWQWVSPKGSGVPMLLLDGDRLVVSVQGYTYCLDPATGNQMWHNPLKGMGIGVPCLASVRGNTTPQLYAALAEYEHQQQEAASHTAGS